MLLLPSPKGEGKPLPVYPGTVACVNLGVNPPVFDDLLHRCEFGSRSSRVNLIGVNLASGEGGTGGG